METVNLGIYADNKVAHFMPTLTIWLMDNVGRKVSPYTYLPNHQGLIQGDGWQIIMDFNDLPPNHINVMVKFRDVSLATMFALQVHDWL